MRLFIPDELGERFEARARERGFTPDELAAILCDGSARGLLTVNEHSWAEVSRIWREAMNDSDWSDRQRAIAVLMANVPDDITAMRVAQRAFGFLGVTPGEQLEVCNAMLTRLRATTGGADA